MVSLPSWETEEFHANRVCSGITIFWLRISFTVFWNKKWELSVSFNSSHSPSSEKESLSWIKKIKVIRYGSESNTFWLNKEKIFMYFWSIFSCFHIFRSSWPNLRLVHPQSLKQVVLTGVCLKLIAFLCYWWAAGGPRGLKHCTTKLWTHQLNNLPSIQEAY